jgi:ribosome biogenesis GTPase / thiamine phosphate phosphatase
LEGLVIKSTGSWITIRKPDGGRLECKLKGQFKIHGKKSTNPVAVGDRVEYKDMPEHGIGLITEIKERHNYIIRKATKLARIYHVMAANLDQAVLIVTVVLPRTSTGFIDRFLTTAEAYHIPASLVFNKIDIYDETAQHMADEMMKLYTNVGYPCYQVSALRGDGIPELVNLLKGKITLMSGHSGVGKTAIINALQPDLNLKVGELSG